MISLGAGDRPLVWLHGEVKTPPFSRSARVEIGSLLRRLQGGEALSLPYSRPMPVIGPRCHELRIVDKDRPWRILYPTDPDAILVLDVFRKRSRKTPKRVIDRARRRLRAYDELTGGRDG